VAGVIAIWVARPSVLQSSDELFAALGDGLAVVEQKTMQADALVGKIQAGIAPIAGEVTQLAQKADSRPEDERILNRIRGELSQHLGQLDALAEVAESAVAMLTKTTQLTKSLRLPAARSSAAETTEDAKDRSAALARVATKLGELRENLAKIQTNQRVPPDIAGAVTGAVRDVEQDLKLLDSKLEGMRESAVQWRTQVEDMRTSVPWWINCTAYIGSVILAWMGLGQFALLRWARQTVRANPST
jgi:chromosome segregation ATPase